MNKYYYFNPWEIDLLNHISTSVTSLDIIVPFIKISIVKKIITLLHDKPDVSIRVCSRFDKNVFLQKSSDISVFELLLTHPKLIDRVNLFSKNNLHAKVYIIDKKIMFISSSNLSRAGLNSNYEIAIKIENQEEIEHVIHTFKEDEIFSNLIDLNEITLMKEILSIELKKSIKTMNLSTIQQESSIIPEISSILVNNYEEVISEDPSIILQNNILDEINQISNRPSISELHKINEYEFESVKKPLYHPENIIDEEKIEIDKIWEEKAQKDLKQITTYIQSIFEKYDFNKITLVHLTNIFIDNSWKNLFLNKKFSELNSYYLLIGNQFFNFYIRLCIIKDRYFAEEKALYYDDLFAYISKNYPYQEILNKTGLNFYLFIGDLNTSIYRDLVFKIIGFLLLNTSYSTFLNFFTQLFNYIDDYVYDDYITFNYKSRLMDLVQEKYKQTPQYLIINEEGLPHQKKFFAQVKIKNKILGTGEGTNKQLAEVEAAKNALKDFFSKKISYSPNNRQYKKLHKYYLVEKRVKTLKNLSNILEIKNLQLLDIALTHSSFINEEQNSRSYKKLAYVGSYLEQLILSIVCFSSIKDYSSTEELKKFTHLRQKLHNVHEQYFDNLELKKYISYLSIVKVNQTIKSDVIQALISVKYIENGFDSVISFVKNLWEEEIINYTNLNYNDLASPKTKLYSIVQSFYKKDISNIIEFKLLSERREPGNRILYTIQCIIKNVTYGIGQDYSKKKAEIEAARRTLENDKFKTNFFIE